MHVVFGTVDNTMFSSNANAMQLVHHTGADIEAAASRASSGLIGLGLALSSSGCTMLWSIHVTNQQTL